MMYSIYLSLLNYSYSMQSRSKVKVFLHTSCIMDDDLDKLFSSDRIKSHFCLILMNDCYHEVKLLEKSRIDGISEKAKMIIKHCIRYTDGNMRDHYRYDETQSVPTIMIKLEPSENNEYIFVFYNPSVAEEFLLNTTLSEKSIRESIIRNIDISPMDHIKILTFNKGLNKKIDYDYSYTSPVKLSAFTSDCFPRWNLWRKPKAIDVCPGDSTQECEKFYIKGLIKGKVLVLPKKRLRTNILGGGGHADVYLVKNCAELQDKALKIFRNKYISGFNNNNSLLIRKYLSELKEYNKIFGDRIALPEAIVTDESNEVVGFVMKRFDNLTTVYDLPVLKNSEVDMDHYDPMTKAADLALLLLEMSLFQLKMTDISYRNICFKDEKDVVIVDADSIESQSFIFNQYFITPQFTHKRLIPSEKDFFLGLKKGRAEHFSDIFSDFSFAVMLYHLYYLNSPLALNGEKCEVSYPNWKKAKEAWEKAKKEGKTDIMSVTKEYARIPKPLDEKWKNGEIPERVRASFTDHFSGDTIYTIGQWIDVLNLE